MYYEMNFFGSQTSEKDVVLDKIYLMVTIVVFAALIIYPTISFFRIMSMDRAKDTMTAFMEDPKNQEAIETAKGILDTTEKLNNFKNQNAAIAKKIEASPTIEVDDINMITAQAKGVVRFTSIKIDYDAVDINGEVYVEQDIYSFAERLEKTGRFKALGIPSFTRSGATGAYEFQMNFTIKE